MEKEATQSVAECAEYTVFYVMGAAVVDWLVKLPSFPSSLAP